MNVEAINTAFPRFPKTVQDKGWVYGVWYCGAAWTKVRLHGQYPPTFLKRALALFPEAQQILHCPSGTLDEGITVDRVLDSLRRPKIQADCAALPFKDATFDLILADPPYTKKDAAIYGCPPFPSGKFLRECHRILRDEAYLGFLCTSYPAYRRKDWHLCGLICVVTGFHRATRMFSIFRRQPR